MSLLSISHADLFMQYIFQFSRACSILCLLVLSRVWLNYKIGLVKNYMCNIQVTQRPVKTSQTIKSNISVLASLLNLNSDSLITWIWDYLFQVRLSCYDKIGTKPWSNRLTALRNTFVIHWQVADYNSYDNVLCFPL